MYTIGIFTSLSVGDGWSMELQSGPDRCKGAAVVLLVNC